MLLPCLSSSRFERNISLLHIFILMAPTSRQGIEDANYLRETEYHASDVTSGHEAHEHAKCVLDASGCFSVAQCVCARIYGHIYGYELQMDRYVSYTRACTH